MAGIAAPIRDMITQLKTVTALLFVQTWNNQVSALEDGSGYSFALPAAFVETIAPFQQIGAGFGAADITFRVHLLTNEFDAGNGEMDMNFSIFDLRDAVLAALVGYQPTACSVLQRGTEQQDTNHTNLYHLIIDFQTHFIDSKGSPYDPEAEKYIDKAPPITLELNATIQ